jgi:hypothetical protein
VWILWNDEAWRMRRSLNALKFNWVSFWMNILFEVS